MLKPQHPGFQEQLKEQHYTAERDILFPENHILSPSLSLSGICAKTESFSDGCVQTQLFWSGYHCHFCNNMTPQECGCNSPSLGFQEKALFTVPIHALRESYCPLISKNEIPLQPTMPYLSLIITSSTLELGINPISIITPLKMNSTPAFTELNKKQLSPLNFRYYPQPEAHWNIPGLFLSSIILHAAR